jgi:hypothetical protein
VTWWIGQAPNAGRRWAGNVEIVAGKESMILNHSPSASFGTTNQPLDRYDADFEKV